tara:strand:+ start:1383 stop:1526 length:144 start_codon:yes stop_codon:yes gene_type:complete
MNKLDTELALILKTILVLGKNGLLDKKEATALAAEYIAKHKKLVAQA